MKAKIILALFIVMAIFVGGTQVVYAQTSLPPERPSGYYGEIDFVLGDGEPTTASSIEAYVPGVSGPVVSSNLVENGSDGLVYSLKVPADNPATPEKDGGVSGDEVTFMIGDRIVAVVNDSWLNGSMTMINVHPPKASATSPAVAVAGEAVSFTGSAQDMLTTDTFTYAWDLDGDSAYDDSTDQNPTYTYTTTGTFTASLRVTDSQGGEGYDSVEMVVVSLSGLTAQEYDGIAKTVTVGGLVSPYSATVTYNDSSTAPTDAGTYTVVVSIYDGGTLVGRITKTMVIDQRPISVSADAKQKTYGDDDPDLTYQVVGSLVPGDSWTGALSRAEGENVGTYAITQGGLTAGPNYLISFTGGNLTINKRPITVTADNKSKVYGTADPELTYSITDGSLAFSDAFTGELTRQEGGEVGTYAIEQGTLALSDDYEMTFIEGTLTIYTSTVTVTATAGQTKVYGTDDPVFAYTYTPSDPPVTFTGALSRVPGNDVGTYAITIGSLTAPAGYTIQFVSANFTITPASATIAISSSLDLDYDGQPKSVTATTEPAGLTYSVTYDGESSAPINTGTYEVSAQITDINYTATVATGTLVIRETQTLTLQSGWNLISFNLQPYPSNAPSDLFASISGSYDLVYAWDPVDGWLLFDNIEQTIDTLDEIDETMGIWIHIKETSAIDLDVKGFFPTETTIALVEGWNLIGFPSSSSQQTSSATSSLGVTFDRLFGYNHTDTQERWLVYDQSVPAYVNDLTDLNPGSGYWIKVTEPVNWVIAYE